MIFNKYLLVILSLLFSCSMLGLSAQIWIPRENGRCLKISLTRLEVGIDVAHGYIIYKNDNANWCIRIGDGRDRTCRSATNAEIEAIETYIGNNPSIYNPNLISNVRIRPVVGPNIADGKDVFKTENGTWMVKKECTVYGVLAKKGIEAMEAYINKANNLNNGATPAPNIGQEAKIDLNNSYNYESMQDFIQSLNEVNEVQEYINLIKQFYLEIESLDEQLLIQQNVDLGEKLGQILYRLSPGETEIFAVIISELTNPKFNFENFILILKNIEEGVDEDEIYLLNQILKNGPLGQLRIQVIIQKIFLSKMM